MDLTIIAFQAVCKIASVFVILDSKPSLRLALPPFHERNLSRHCVQLIELQGVVGDFLPKGPTENTSS